MAWISVNCLTNKCWLCARKYLSQSKWSQMKSSPIKHIQVASVWVCMQYCGIRNRPWVLCIPECDRRPLQIPTQTLSVAQHSIVGLFQSAMVWKAAIDISPTHLVASFNNNCGPSNMGSNVLISADRSTGELGCLKEKVSGVPCCVTLRKFPS